MTFPTAEGTYEKFNVVEASIMHPDLAAKYPGIKSYAGYSLDDPGAMIRFSVSHKGLSSMKLYGSTGSVFIEPYSADYTSYMVYNRRDKAPSKSSFECLTEDVVNKSTDQVVDRNADDGIFRTFRLAMSATGEYTSFHGGTVADALAAINTTMTRVNGIFETDFGTTMVLIANTDQVIYTSSSSDPYTSSLNSQLQSTLTSVIGESNYDVGHLVTNASNNGNAGCIGCVCVDGTKGSGFSSHTNPQGDNFDVDYVAHEIGHQFGANHTWTFGGSEGTGVQMEPGSGSTIMGYAGITGSTDVQDHSDPYFHAASIEQATDHIKSRTCATTVNTGNSIPTIDAGADVTIPRGTPFLLSAVGSDADGDALTYVWEQMNNGSSNTTFPSVNATSGPVFRSINPTSSPDRSFPAIATVLAGNTSTQWEAVPNVARTMNFRVTVRDNQAGGPANNSDDIVVTVNSATGPFEVSAPNTNVTWNSGTSQTVTWDVAGTDGSPVNAANVNILLSTDGGLTYPTTLASNTANDGSESISVPALATSTARVKVEAAGNVFYDVSNADFTIEISGPCTVTVPSGLSSSAITSSAATISWNTVSGATSYDYQYRTTGAGSWNTASTSATSANLSGLSALTDYEFQVRAVCPDETSAYSASSNFTTLDIGGSNCATGPVTLSITFDNYPEETSWTITNSGGSIVASGGTYGSQADGSTLTQDITLDGGDFTFTLNDSYGDGICCAYGSGSYTLTDALGTVLASGGSFASSEATDFCMDAPPADTEAPSAPGSLSASGTTQTSTDLSWSASTDNVAVTGYNVYVNGSLDGTTTSTSYSVSGLTASTTYTMAVSASDAASNESAQSSISVTTEDAGSGTTTTLFANFFESGWDGWTDGGSDCFRYSGTRSYEGSYSIRLRDNSGTRSAMTSQTYDVSSYDQIDVEFYFYPNSMESGEDFWVRFYDGSSWQTVASYAAGTSFNNGSFYVATVTINSGDYNFASNSQFRFQCDASANGDQVYIDAVTVTGTSGSARSAGNTITQLNGLRRSPGLDGFDLEEGNIALYPNPATVSATVRMELDEAVELNMTVLDLQGREVQKMKWDSVQGSFEHTIDVSKMDQGLYFVNIKTSEGEKEVVKLMVTK